MNKIDELEVGCTVYDTFMLTEATVRQTNTRPPRDYLSVTFSVGNVTIDGKMWNWPRGAAVPETKKVYDVAATVGEYLGKKQLTITELSVAEDQDLTDFVPSVGISKIELWATLITFIDSIENEKLKHIVSYCYTLYKEEILATTAGKKMHHVGLGGLALHTIEVACNAGALTLANKHLQINEPLVIAGALLHDIGKIYTYYMEDAVLDVTIPGMLYDHITMGVVILHLANSVLGAEYNNEINLLQHIIVSHHGELEYGSPVTPKFMEAYIVNWADNISATLDMINTANLKAGDADKTEKIYACSNREHITQNYVMRMLAEAEAILVD